MCHECQQGGSVLCLVSGAGVVTIYILSTHIYISTHLHIYGYCLLLAPCFYDAFSDPNIERLRGIQDTGPGRRVDRGWRRWGQAPYITTITTPSWCADMQAVFDPLCLSSLKFFPLITNGRVKTSCGYTDQFKVVVTASLLYCKINKPSLSLTLNYRKEVAVGSCGFSTSSNIGDMSAELTISITGRILDILPPPRPTYFVFVIWREMDNVPLFPH